MNQSSEVLRGPREWLIPALVLGVCGVAGLAVAVSPAVGAGLALALCGFSIALAIPGVATRFFLGLLAFILFGYAFMGRGFAYLGAAPVFIGEITLAIGLLALIFDNRRFVSLKSPLTWLLLGFLLWGAATTLPYYPVFGIMSLRDAVLWGYGILALAVIPPMVRNNGVERAASLYGKLAPLYIVWVPIAVFIDSILRESLPYVPGTEVPIIDNKTGDLNVHLGGAAAFLLLGIGDRLHRGPRGLSAMPLTRMALWTIWLAGFAMAAVLNRGGMLSVFAAIGVVVMVRPMAVAKRLAMLAVIGFILISGLLLSGLEIRMSDRRPLSIEQFTQNIASIFSEEENQDGTRRWRLMWWGDIVNYTVFGPYRVTGKGYGVNLADSDGYQVSSDGSLRSPHNGHMTILARGGVPHILLWMAVHLGFAFTLFKTYTRSRRMGDESLAGISIWLLAYWAAFMVNATFDVFLEGPQGGIWLWAVFGMGVATSLLSQERERRWLAHSPGSGTTSQQLVLQTGREVEAR